MMERNQIVSREELTREIERNVLSTASKAVTVEANYFHRLAPGSDAELIENPESMGFSEGIKFYEVINELTRDGYTVKEPYASCVSDYYRVSLGKKTSVIDATESFKRKYGALILTAWSIAFWSKRAVHCAALLNSKIIMRKIYGNHLYRALLTFFPYFSIICAGVDFLCITIGKSKLIQKNLK